MKDCMEERTYKSLWHLLIALVGVYELRNHKTKLSKALACGLIAFHADAALCDAAGMPTTAQRLLRKLKPKKEMTHAPRNRKKKVSVDAD